MKQTKIVATVGPVSRDKEVLKKMMEAGMNICRMNFSHSEHEWHKETMHNVREAAQELELPIGIIADLQGPRIRTIVSEDVVLEIGETIVLCEKEVLDEQKQAGHKVIAIDQEGITRQLAVSQNVLIADGLISLVVESVGDLTLQARVVDPGTVGNHKGMNFPKAIINIPALTEKDISDLEFAVREGVEYIALSFVGKAVDVEDLRHRIEQLEEDVLRRPKIIVKIEKEEALTNLDEIIDATDAVMVARGDLATEVGQERIGVLQKDIIRRSLEKARPVIVATQMLESMIEHPRPTRAEISDVANAVIDHADATMLSGESANGKYPVEAVRAMAEIISETEESPFDDVLEALDTNVKTPYIEMIRGIYELSKHGNAETLLVTTRTGETARLISHFRPQTPLIVGTGSEHVYRKLALVWGVQQILYKGVVDEEEIMRNLYSNAKQKGHVKVNDEVACIYRDPKSGRKKIEMEKVL